MRQDRKNDEGFTLLEVVLAFGLVCVCCALVIGSLVSLERLSTVCSTKEQATIALSDAIEAARSSRKAEIVAAAGQNGAVKSGHADVHAANLTAGASGAPVAAPDQIGIKLTAEQHGARGLSLSLSSALILEREE